MRNVADLINEAVGLARFRQHWYLEKWQVLADKLADGDEGLRLDVLRVGQLDVLLRELGFQLAAMWRREDQSEYETHVPASSTAYSLSVAWIFEAYEMTRVQRNRRGDSCPASLREVHRRINLVRMPLAKGEAAGTNRNPRGPTPYRSKPAVELEGGTYAWTVMDAKLGAEVEIVREHLSVEMLRMSEEDWSANTV